MILALLTGCLGDCLLSEEPASEADLPFSEEALLASMAAYAPSEIVWGTGSPGFAVPPFGLETSPITLTITPRGDGFVQQARRKTGRMCGDPAETEILPVTVETSIAEGQVIQVAPLFLGAHNARIEDAVLDTRGFDGRVPDTEAEVSEAWAQDCAAAHADTVHATLTRFWMLLNGPVTPISVHIYGANADETVDCWRGEVAS